MIKSKVVLLAGVFLLTLLSGCQSPVPAGKTSTRGILNITADTSQLNMSPNRMTRTVVPAGMDFAAITYGLKLVPSSPLSSEVNLSNSTGVFTVVTIDSGTWQATLTAVCGGQTIGVVTQTLVIGTTDVSLSLILNVPTGTGTAGVTVTWPSGHSLQVSGSLVNLATAATTVLSAQTTSPAQWLGVSLPAGIYDLTLTAVDGTQPVGGVKETLYVFNSQTSAAAFTLGDSGLTPSIPASPSGLRADWVPVMMSTSYLDLSWQAADRATQYKVYRIDTSCNDGVAPTLNTGTGTLMATLNSSCLTWRDTITTSTSYNDWYTYRVEAVNSYGTASTSLTTSWHPDIYALYNDNGLLPRYTVNGKTIYLQPGLQGGSPQNIRIYNGHICVAGVFWNGAYTNEEYWMDGVLFQGGNNGHSQVRLVGLTTSNTPLVVGSSRVDNSRPSDYTPSLWLGAALKQNGAMYTDTEGQYFDWADLGSGYSAASYSNEGTYGSAVARKAINSIHILNSSYDMTNTLTLNFHPGKIYKLGSTLYIFSLDGTQYAQYPIPGTFSDTTISATSALYPLSGTINNIRDDGTALYLAGQDENLYGVYWVLNGTVVKHILTTTGNVFAVGVSKLNTFAVGIEGTSLTVWKNGYKMPEFSSSVAPSDVYF